MKTMKVKPWGKRQGDYVLINESDFDPEKHTPIKSTAKRTTKPSEDKPSEDKPSEEGAMETRSVGEREYPVNPARTARKKTKKKTG